MSNQQNTLVTHIASLSCLIFKWNSCQDQVNLRNHYSLVVKAFASGAGVPLWLWAWTPVSAEVGVTPTVFQKGILVSRTNGFIKM